MKSNKHFPQYSRLLIASTLISGGFWSFSLPVLAEGTAAGTSISNTATASYEDPTDPTKPLNTFSNTVEIKVAEIAGINVVADTFAIAKGSGNTGSGAEAGDTINFDFTVTNVGNDPTKLRIPGTATLTGAGNVSKIQYESAPNTWTDIPNGGEFISGSKDPGESIKVRVIVAVLSGATSGSDISVTLGKTVSPDQQNVLRNADGGDVFTVDNADGTLGETTGVPENGVREASASQKVTIGATPQAFATVTKVRGAQAAGANANSLVDDTLTYTLGLKVADQIDVPSGSNKIAADLAATPIKVGATALAATTQNRILVSDAVPLNTKAEELTVPAGWTAVYTTEATSINANAATWVTITGTGTVAVPAGATRVGFIQMAQSLKAALFQVLL